MDLIHVIYYSSATHDLSGEELKEIHLSSIKHNTKNNLTGMLLYYAGNFMQVLEGATAAVDETMARINQDARHHDVFVIDHEPIREREFSAWQMGFRKLVTSDLMDQPDYLDAANNRFKIDAFSTKPSSAMELLRHFSRSHQG